MAELQGVLKMLSAAGGVGVVALLSLAAAQVLRVLLYAGLVWWMARATSRQSVAYPTFIQLVGGVGHAAGGQGAAPTAQVTAAQPRTARSRAGRRAGSAMTSISVILSPW